MPRDYFRNKHCALSLKRTRTRRGAKASTKIEKYDYGKNHRTY